MAVPIFEAAERYADRIALIDPSAQVTFRELLEESSCGAAELRARAPQLERVALLAPGGIDYVVGQWSIWRAGGCCVPLCTTHPAPELAYALDEAKVSAVVVQPELHELIAPLAHERNLPLLSTTALRSAASVSASALPELSPDGAALILFTSGTTGKPKGVVSTHRVLSAQIASVVQGWEITQHDRILHALPLHHLHGILNALCAVLSAGGSCRLLPRFEVERVAHALTHDDALTLFMGVPTMYARLAQRWDAMPAVEQAAFTEGCKRMRLLVSGSAALPVAMLERFAAMSGHTLLERYGMSELGMVLGNPLHGERVAGSVGVPFPGVEVRLMSERGSPVPDAEPGEIQVRGPNVFREYFGRPDATRAAFTSDGFFRTGDIAIRQDGRYRILGRESVDILKTGGFKVSALEIEDVLRTHEAIADCAVVGVPDEEWGQKVAALVELREGFRLDPAALREWGKQRLAPYKVPTLVQTTTALPRNALGKVQKPDVLKMFQAPK